MNLSELKELAREGKIIRLYKGMPFTFHKRKFIYGDGDRYLGVKEIEVTKYRYVAFIGENEGYKINKKDYGILQKIIDNVKREI